MNRTDYDELLSSLAEGGPTPPLSVVSAALDLDPNFLAYLTSSQLAELVWEARALGNSEGGIIGVFRDPPPDRRKPPVRARTRELDAVAEQCRRSPNTWMLVEENAYPGNTYKFKSRGLQARLSKLPGAEQRFNIYVRWVDEEGKEEP